MTSQEPPDHRLIGYRRDEWYPVCRSDRLRSRPMAAMLFGVPIAVFRTRGGQPGALLDRCPHRNVPLSLGRVRDDRLQCIYHGWEFDRDGLCRSVPGLVGPARERERRATSFTAVESQGLVWAYGEPDVVAPARAPFRFPHADEPGYTTAREVLEVEASLHAAAENALDVPHTAFLHGGLFRNPSRERRDIEVIVRRLADRVEAEYVGETRPPGAIAKLLAPKGGEVTHVDRFILPSIAQVEYRLGDSHLCISAALAPVEDDRTRLFVSFSFRLPLPGWMLSPVLRPLALRVFRQDAWMLARQTQTIRRFGGESYKFTEIDVLGAEILDLLRNGRTQRAADSSPDERRLRMSV